MNFELLPVTEPTWLVHLEDGSFRLHKVIGWIFLGPTWGTCPVYLPGDAASTNAVFATTSSQPRTALPTESAGMPLVYGSYDDARAWILGRIGVAA